MPSWTEYCFMAKQALIAARPGAGWESQDCDVVYTEVCLTDCTLFSYFDPIRYGLCATLDCPAPTFSDAFWAQIYGNPNFYTQLREWWMQVIAAGQNPYDWPRFQQHLLAIGAPDPGTMPPDDFWTLPLPTVPPPSPPSGPEPSTVNPNTSACSTARQRLVAMAPGWQTATCEQIQRHICCDDATIFVGNDPIRIGLCGSGTFPSPTCAGKPPPPTPKPTPAPPCPAGQYKDTSGQCKPCPVPTSRGGVSPIVIGAIGVALAVGIAAVISSQPVRSGG